MMVNKFLKINGINVGEFFGEMGLKQLIDFRGIDQALRRSARRRVTADITGTNLFFWEEFQIWAEEVVP